MVATPALGIQRLSISVDFLACAVRLFEVGGDVLYRGEGRSGENICRRFELLIVGQKNYGKERGLFRAPSRLSQVIARRLWAVGGYVLVVM